mgnify:CR=1 FL=1
MGKGEMGKGQKGKGQRAKGKRAKAKSYIQMRLPTKGNVENGEIARAIKKKG